MAASIRLAMDEPMPAPRLPSGGSPRACTPIHPSARSPKTRRLAAAKLSTLAAQPPTRSGRVMPRASRYALADMKTSQSGTPGARA
jgi:hypothetical protein